MVSRHGHGSTFYHGIGHGWQLSYPVARGKIPPPCLIGVEEAGIGRPRTAGEQARQWFWKVVLGIQGAQERCSGNSSGPESCFGNSSGQFCGPAKSCWELNWPRNVVLGIQVARSVVQEMRFWNSSCRGKAFWEFQQRQLAWLLACSLLACLLDCLLACSLARLLACLLARLLACLFACLLLSCSLAAFLLEN